MLLVNLLQDTLADQTALDLLCAQMLVARNVDVVDLHLVFPLDVHIHDNLVGSTGIVPLNDVYLSILVSLLCEIALCKNLCTVNHVGCQLVVLDQSHLLLQVVLLVLPNTIDVDFGDARTLRKLDVQVAGVTNETVHPDGHIAEESVAPVAFHGFRDFFAGNLNLLSLCQSAQSNEKMVVVVLHAIDGNLTDVVLSGCAAIVDFRSHFTLHHLREQRIKQSEKSKYY